MKKHRDWNGNFLDFVKAGDQVDEKIYLHFLFELPPIKNHENSFLMGEAYSRNSQGHKTYMMFHIKDRRYYYGGIMSLAQYECFVYGFNGRLSHRTGNWITSELTIDISPYHVANSLDDKWVKIPTAADSAYLGVWINRDELQTLTYCEGDLTTVHCLDQEGLDREYSDIQKFYNS